MIEKYCDNGEQFLLSLQTICGSHFEQGGESEFTLLISAHRFRCRV